MEWFIAYFKQWYRVWRFLKSSLKILSIYHLDPTFTYVWFALLVLAFSTFACGYIDVLTCNIQNLYYLTNLPPFSFNTTVHYVFALHIFAPLCRVIASWLMLSVLHVRHYIKSYLILSYLITDLLYGNPPLKSHPWVSLTKDRWCEALMLVVVSLVTLLIK